MSQTQELFLHKQTRVKENRLDKAAVRFNSSLANNSQLRSRIDHLRKERSVFEGQYKQLQRVWNNHTGCLVAKQECKYYFLIGGRNWLSLNEPWDRSLKCPPKLMKLGKLVYNIAYL